MSITIVGLYSLGGHYFFKSFWYKHARIENLIYHKACQMLEAMKQEALQLEPVLGSYGALKFSHTFPM